jgi:2,3-bisphosphoglycerate-dependent phosphoglycerate mutase
MNLYLVRHGLSTWNVSGRLQGWANTDLTPEGFEQAQRTAEFFSDFVQRRRMRFYALYSSPLLRAWLTAHAIGERLGLVPIPVDDLREMQGGAVEGLRREEWQRRYPELIPGWSDRKNLDFGWPGGETRRAFRNRCMRAISEIVAQHKSYDNIIVVTHGGVIKAYLNSAGLDDPMGPRSYEADNCSVTHIQFMGSDTGDDRGGEIWSVGCLRIFNQVEHLRDEDSDVDEELVATARADLALQ